MEFKKLNNGLKIPSFGIGTFLLEPDVAENSVFHALKNGYRLIDTANVYVNEKAVGRGMKKSGIPREEIFWETQLWPTVYEDYTSIDKTLERLGTDYIDLMILHQPAGNYIEGYKILEKGYKEGKLKSIGLSNFSEIQIREIMDSCEIIPTLLQVECHPYFPQTNLRNFLNEHNIILQAWYPLGHGDKTLIEQPIFDKLSKKYNKSKVQIILRWHIQMDNVVIPGTSSEEHIKQNIDIFDFELTKDEMEEIAKLDKNEPYFKLEPNGLQRFLSWHPDIEGQK